MAEACPLCDGALQAEQEWCLRCGAAARTRLAATPNWRLPIAAIVTALALSLGVLTAALVDLAGSSSPTRTVITRTLTRIPAAAVPAPVSPATTAPGATGTLPPAATGSRGARTTGANANGALNRTTSVPGGATGRPGRSGNRITSRGAVTGGLLPGFSVPQSRK